MAFAAYEPVLNAGLKNTLKFVWKREDKDFMNRRNFARQVLVDILDVDTEGIYCMQGNGGEGAYYVTFCLFLDYCRAYAAAREHAGAEPLCDFTVELMQKNAVRVVTVHTCNPFVEDEVLIYFLSRYTKVILPAKYLRDDMGIWNGRQFRVELYEDASGYDGFRHPPAYFSLGSDRGYLFYANQPMFCRNCREYGHWLRAVAYLNAAKDWGAQLPNALRLKCVIFAGRMTIFSTIARGCGGPIRVGCERRLGCRRQRGEERSADG